MRPDAGEASLKQGSSDVVLSEQRSAGVLPEKSPARQLILFLSCI